MYKPLSKHQRFQSGDKCPNAELPGDIPQDQDMVSDSSATTPPSQAETDIGDYLSGSTSLAAQGAFIHPDECDPDWPRHEDHDSGRGKLRLCGEGPLRKGLGLAGVGGAYELEDNCEAYGSKSGRDLPAVRYGFLDLPTELIWNILLEVPTDSLAVCLELHPTLRGLILTESFIDAHTRLILGFDPKYDCDVTSSCLPSEINPLMTLWTLSQLGLQYAHSLPSVPALAKSPLLPLLLFRHSLYTWLTQARLTKMITTQDMMAAAFSSDPRIEELSEVNIFPSQAFTLPKFLIQPLTRLTLAFPTFLTWTLKPEVLLMRLSVGMHYKLSTVWHLGVPQSLRDGFEVEYSLQVICDTPSRNFDRRLPSVVFFFDTSQWIVWRGEVAPYPGCVFRETHSVVSLSSLITMGELRESLEETLSDLLQINDQLRQVVSNQQIRQKWYPGICFFFQTHFRDCLITDLVDNLEKFNMKLPSGKVPRHSSCIFFSDFITDSQEIHGINNFLDQDRTSGQKCSVRSCDFLQTFCKNLSSVSLIGNDFITSVSDCAIQSLHSVFSAEVLYFVCNSDCHQFLCRQCSKCWFSNNSSQSQCIEELRTRQDQTLPWDTWPVHLLLEAIATVQMAMRAIENE